MNRVLKMLSPSATDMIRADHTRVLGVFHRYDVHARPQMKAALVNGICLSLEVHAQIEEEIFYPAMREAQSTIVNQQLVPEHNEMRRLMTQLRDMHADDPQYDQTFMELMRNVVHHVADEETILLPMAERVLAERLGELGGQMMKRRMELTAPRAGELARYKARAMPPGALVAAAGAVLAGAYFLRNVGRR